MKNFAISYNPSLHEEKIIQFFGESATFVDRVDKRFSNYRIFFICFSNRCGSNALAEAIGGSPKYNVAGENLNFDAVINNSKKYGFEKFSDYLFWLVKNFSSEKGIFGVKASWEQLYFLAKIGVLTNCFSGAKFIYIRRQDILSQAASFLVAEQTKQWTSYQGKSIDESEVVMDENRVMLMLDGILTSEARFRKFFALYGCDFFEITYEDFFSEPVHSLECIYKFLWDEVDFVSFDMDRMRTRKQVSSMKDKYVKMILERFSLF